MMMMIMVILYHIVYLRRLFFHNGSGSSIRIAPEQRNGVRNGSCKPDAFGCRLAEIHIKREESCLESQFTGRLRPVHTHKKKAEQK